MTMNDPLGTFFGQTSGGYQAGMAQQLQMFMQALQFQQQQAALAQAGTYGTQYGFAPGGNWMQWGAGGPTQVPAGTPTLAQQQAAMGLQQGALANALAQAGVTGQFAQPTPSQYATGTVLSAPSQTGGGNAYGVVQQDGSVQIVTTEALDQLARQRGTTAQAMINQAAPTDWNTLQRLSMGPPTGPSQQTQAAQQQQFGQAGAAAALTGQFVNPLQSPDALLQQGQAMNGQSFYSLPQTEQQYWLQYNQNNPQQAAQQWARGVNSALQQAGYQNPAAQAQQTLPSQLQQATLSGMYQGAPTEAAREFNATNAVQQGQLGQQYLSTAAQLQGPQNTFQLSNYLRGAQGNPNVPVYLQSLANNMGMPAFQGTGTTAPTTQTAAGLAGQMGGTQSATPGWDYNQTLGQIQNIMGGGAQKLGPGALERLSPDELQAFGSGLGAAGGSLPSFLQQYQQSRVGQQAPTGAPSLA